MADISVDLLDMKLNNPVMPAAGPTVKDAGSALRAKQGGAGALVTKTISVEAARVPRPNLAQTRGGLMNAELWSELPPEQWLNQEYPRIAGLGLPVIAGLGYKAEEIKELAPKVEPYADALELSTHYLGDDPTPVVESIQAAKEVVEIPVMVKLSPQIDIPTFARAAEKAGADGIVLVNSLGPTLDISLSSGRPLMGSRDGFGWLSGEAIFPLALRCVYQVAAAVDIPVLGVGGIGSGREAVKMIMAGASAVQVCSQAILDGPRVYGKIAREIEVFLEENGYQSLEEIKGLAQQQAPQTASYTTRVPEIIRDRCTGCGLCVTSCVYQAIKLDDGNKAVIEEGKCQGCGLCVTRCNFKAISFKN